MRRLLLMALLTLAALAQGCRGASSDPGLSARLQIANAQFVPGDMPEGHGRGPAVVSVHVPHNQVLPGQRDERVSGALEADATSVAVGLAGDDGYWIVAAGVPSLDEPGLPTFDAALTFSRSLSAESAKLALRAFDAEGRFGPEQIVMLTVERAKLEGELVIRLSWDNDADLDLHVVDATGEEVWVGNINSSKAPPVGSLPADPSAWTLGGILDLDSNAACVFDGRSEENVVWRSPPPAGSYQVRVATASLCSADVAHWKLEVWLHRKRVALSEGTAVENDVRSGAGRGAGVHATSFEVP